jgi:hypothetical protein
MVQGNSYANTSLRQGPDSETYDYRRRRSGSIAVEDLSTIFSNHAKDFSVRMTESMGSNLAKSSSAEGSSRL